MSKTMHKNKCKAYCIEYLTSLELSQYFSSSTFEKIYQSINNTFANPYKIALDCAGIILSQSNFMNHESGIEG